MTQADVQSLKKVLIDVREEDEFEAEHVPGSILIPLSRFAQVAPGFLAHLAAKEVVILCRSGNRAKLAKIQLEQMGYQDKAKFSVFEGGIVQWKAEGNKTVEHTKGHLPLVRQVHLIAGACIALASLVAYFIHPAIGFLSVFFGLGLAVSGATGFCGMATILSQMPWNKRVSSVPEELRQISAPNGA